MVAILDKAIESVLDASIKSSNPVLLIGETGTGKTTIIQHKADTAKKTLHRVSLNGSTSVEEIIGKWLAKKGSTYWQDGILLTAMKNGDWIVFDEINAALPEILFSLHSLLDHDRKVTIPEKDNEVVRPHADFRFFANMNPTQDYAGTKDVNMALMSRFAAVLVIEVLDNASEMKLLVDHFGADNKHAEILVRIAHELREEKKKDNIFYFCSTRDLVHTVGFTNAGVDIKDAIRHSIINKMSPKEFEAVKSIFNSVITSVVGRAKSLNELEKELLTTTADAQRETASWKEKFNEEQTSNKELKGKIDSLEKELAKSPKLSETVGDLKKILDKMADEAKS